MKKPTKSNTERQTSLAKVMNKKKAGKLKKHSNLSKKHKNVRFFIKNMLSCLEKYF